MANGSFYQNGLPLSTAETGLGNVAPGAPVANKASSSFYLSGSAYIQSVPALAQASADQAAASAAAAAASLAAMPGPSNAIPAMDDPVFYGPGSALTYSRGDHQHPTDTSRAPLASPGLTGTPTAPTAVADTNTTQLATTAFVIAQASNTMPGADSAGSGPGTSPRYARGDHIHPIDATRAPLASPTLTGVPAAPTAAVNTNTTQLATTAFVLAQAASATPLIDGTATVGTATKFAREDHVHPTDTTRAPLASPTFTGTAAAPIVKPTSAPATAWGIDCSSCTITVSASSNAVLPVGGGMIMLTDGTSTGNTGVYILGGSAAALVSQTGAGVPFVAPTTTPAASKYSVAYNGAGGYSIYNGHTTLAITFTVVMLRTRAAV